MRNIIITLFAFCITANAQESVVDSLEIQNLEEVIVSSIRVKENIPIALKPSVTDKFVYTGLLCANELEGVFTRI